MVILNRVRGPSSTPRSLYSYGRLALVPLKSIMLIKIRFALLLCFSSVPWSLRYISILPQRQALLPCTNSLPMNKRSLALQSGLKWRSQATVENTTTKRLEHKAKCLEGSVGKKRSTVAKREWKTSMQKSPIVLTYKCKQIRESYERRFQ